MNKELENLSLKERFNLQISEKAVQREAKKVKIEQALAGNVQQLECENCDEACMNNALYESIQCMICYQVPICPKECKFCQKIICQICVSQMQNQQEDLQQQHCPYCKEQDSDVFTDIKNRILSDIIDQMKVGHRCQKNQQQKIYTLVQLREHLKDCQGIKVFCFCDPIESNKMTIRDLYEHLRKKCGSVRIQCEYCHADQPEDYIEQASFSRDIFKKHKCYIEMQKLISENETEDFIYQKYKEEFENRNNFKLEIKCFNKCGSNYYQKALYSISQQECCSKCKGIFKREVISECQKCNTTYCEKCFMNAIQQILFMEQI